MLVSELSGDLLALWVARAEGYIIHRQSRPGGAADILHVRTRENENGYSQDIGIIGSMEHYAYAPHEAWAQGGPIIDRPDSRIINLEHPSEDEGYQWNVTLDDQDGTYWGRTLLEAAMRAYVASKFGNTVPDDPHGMVIVGCEFISL